MRMKNVSNSSIKQQHTNNTNISNLSPPLLQLSTPSRRSSFNITQQTVLDLSGFTFAILAVFSNLLIASLMYKQKLHRKKSSWSTLVLIASECFVSMFLIVIISLGLHYDESCDNCKGGNIILFVVILDTIPTGVLLFTARDRYVRLKDLINYSSNFNVKKFWLHCVCSLLHSIILGAFIQNLPHYAVLMPWLLILYFLFISVSGCIFCYKSYRITKNHIHEYSTHLLTKLRKLMRIHIQQMLFLFACYGLRVVVLGLSLTNILPFLTSSVLFNTSIVLNPFLSLLNAMTLIYMDPLVRSLLHSIICKSTQVNDFVLNKNNVPPVHRAVNSTAPPPAEGDNTKNVSNNKPRNSKRKIVRYWTQGEMCSINEIVKSKDLLSQQDAIEYLKIRKRKQKNSSNGMKITSKESPIPIKVEKGLGESIVMANSCNKTKSNNDHKIENCHLNNKRKTVHYSRRVKVCIDGE